MRERIVERLLKEEIKKRDGLCLKMGILRGLPDRLCLLPKGRMFFVETKTPTTTLEKLQKYFKSLLNDLGFQSYVCHSKEHIILLMEYIDNEQRSENASDKSNTEREQ